MLLPFLRRKRVALRDGDLMGAGRGEAAGDETEGVTKLYVSNIISCAQRHASERSKGYQIEMRVRRAGM